MSRNDGVARRHPNAEHADAPPAGYALAMKASWWAARAKAGVAGQPRPATLRFFHRYVEPLVRLAHRPVLLGVEGLPQGRPFMLVANHSGGMAAAELLSFVACYLEQCGAARPLAGFAHPFGFHVWPVSFFLRGIGAIPSTYDAANAALGSGTPVLVFPGGDHEATRPMWQARRVDFGGRRGFLRIARQQHVPIVPMGIAGSHLSVPILCRSRALAWLTVLPRLFGIKRVPLTVLGVVGALGAALLVGPRAGWAWALGVAWLWLASPFPLLPWVPTTVRLRIGEPIEPTELFAAADESLEGAYHRVVGAVQQLVDASYARPSDSMPPVGSSHRCP